MYRCRKNVTRLYRDVCTLRANGTPFKKHVNRLYRVSYRRMQKFQLSRRPFLNEKIRNQKMGTYSTVILGPLGLFGYFQQVCFYIKVSCVSFVLYFYTYSLTLSKDFFSIEIFISTTKKHFHSKSVSASQHGETHLNCHDRSLHFCGRLKIIALFHNFRTHFS